MDLTIKKIVTITGSCFILLSATHAYASTGRKKQCRTDIAEMRAEIQKWHGPVHALNAAIDSIGKGKYTLKKGICTHPCATWATGEGTCTWQKGVWTTTLMYSQP